MKRFWLRAFAVLAVVVAHLALSLWIVRTIQNYRRDPSSSDRVDELLPLLRHGYYSVQLGGGHGEDFHNVTVRNNSSDKDMTVGTSNSVANVAF
jgi:hypothetical protein